MEQPGIARAVAGERERDARLAPVAEAHCRAEADRQRVRQVADEAKDAEVQVAHAVQVHVAAVSDARGAAKQVGEHPPRGDAAQQERAQVAVHRRDDVIWPQRIARADADRLMPALAERPAHAAALLPVRQHPIIERARQAHPVIEVELVGGGEGVL